MRCLNPRTVGFKADGKTISWSQKSYSKEYATFQLPCSKCIECRLEYARQWAVRCVHESKMFEKNSFITLTYSDQHLVSSKLEYRDFQLFAKKLRKKIFTDFVGEFGKYNWSILSKEERKQVYEPVKIGIFVTGEYGDLTKRPHWHALVFNWAPSDLKPKYKNKRGDQVYSSSTLDLLWGKGITEVGSVTFESAGYVARYAAKKLVHGRDEEHQYVPVSKKSSHQAIGKRFLEKYWRDIFSYGRVVLSDGTETSIPRYYDKWLHKNHPEEYLRYVTQVKTRKMRDAESRQLEEEQQYIYENSLRTHGRGNLIDKRTVKRTIIEAKFKQLQQWLKGDI